MPASWRMSPVPGLNKTATRVRGEERPPSRCQLGLAINKSPDFRDHEDFSVLFRIKPYYCPIYTLRFCSRLSYIRVNSAEINGARSPAPGPVSVISKMNGRRAARDRPEASAQPRPNATDVTTAPPPAGAYLQSLTVSGFRGIGPSATWTRRITA